MMNTIRQCQVQGHHYTIPTRICILKECNQHSRWCCAECIIDNLHSHGQPNQNHVKKQEEFIAYLKEQEKSQSNNIIQDCLDDMIQSAKKLISLLSNLLWVYQTNYSAIITQATNDFLSIDKAQINEIVNVNNKHINLQQSLHLLQEIKAKLHLLYAKCSNQEILVEENIQQQQQQKQQQCQSSNREQIQPLSLRKIQQTLVGQQEIAENKIPKLEILCKYKQSVEIERTSVLRTALSENFVAFGFSVAKPNLNIYDIKKNTIILRKEFLNFIFSFLFSDDGRYLYVSFSNQVIVKFEAKYGFQSTKTQFFFDTYKVICTIEQILTYNQVIVKSKNLFNNDIKYIHLDVKKKKIIAVFRKFISENILELSHDDKINCILCKIKMNLTVFSIINRSVVFTIEMNNIPYFSLLGGNKIQSQMRIVS